MKQVEKKVKLKKYDFAVTKIEIRPQVPEVLMKVAMSTMENMYTSHFFFITKPYVDEERIRRDIVRKYQSMIEQGLFSDDLRKTQEEDILKAIAMEKLRIADLPEGIAFNADVVQAKNVAATELILRIPTDGIVIRLYENFKYLKEMKLVVGEPYSVFVKDNSSVIDAMKEEDPKAKFFGILNPKRPDSE